MSKLPAIIMPSEINHGIDGSRPSIRTLNLIPLRRNYDNLPKSQLNSNPTSTDSREMSSSSSTESASRTMPPSLSPSVEPDPSPSSASDPATYYLEPCELDKADAVILTNYATPVLAPANPQSPSANLDEGENAPKRNMPSPPPIFLIGPALRLFRDTVALRSLTTTRVHPYKILRSNPSDHTKEETGDSTESPLQISKVNQHSC